ncbi:hypothetical protein AWB64_02101 [Caballeronia sordidicola]|uniref:Uncharacterized protein n=1 Tax=Caballeronia sordidicola TaxID=196367 RepID=A0A158G346_CABSO|nr:hypothetical protein [Caballeronia sordidicola]SAL25820.1 hypothetical protein AWB64_02101 [Caballeronia sordidicola]
MKAIKLVSLSALLLAVSGLAMAQSGGGNGNGGGGGGNAHGAATAGPTTGGDNSSTPGSSRGKPHLFKHKQKKTAPAAAQ